MLDDGVWYLSCTSNVWLTIIPSIKKNNIMSWNIAPLNNKSTIAMGMRLLKEIYTKRVYDLVKYIVQIQVF